MAGEIEITGVDRVVARLGSVKGIEHLRAPMTRGVARLHQSIAVYPPEPQGSSYVRTGSLGRKWVTKVAQSVGELIGTIGNNLWHAPIVQSQRFQAWMHRRTGWQTDQQVMERERGNIVRDFQQAIKEALNR